MATASTHPAQLRWVPEDPTARLGVLVTLGGRVLVDGVTLDEACTLYIGETVTAAQHTCWRLCDH